MKKNIYIFIITSKKNIYILYNNKTGEKNIQNINKNKIKKNGLKHRNILSQR